MKKWMLLLLAALMLLSLCACGESAQETEPTDEETVENTEITLSTEELLPDPTEAETQPSPMSLAQSCIGKSVDELVALIGEPQSTDYAPSCLNPGVGEDGNWYYDGFTVYTYREGDVETVEYVE